LSSDNYVIMNSFFGAVAFNTFASVFTVFRNCVALRNIEPNLGFGVGFFVDATSDDCLVQNCIAVDNSAEGFTNISPTSVFVGNLAFANPFNYAAFGPLGFITVVNGTQPPALTFDERQIDNISIV
jgi:hypothetical protein